MYLRVIYSSEFVFGMRLQHIKHSNTGLFSFYFLFVAFLMLIYITQIKTDNRILLLG